MRFLFLIALLTISSLSLPSQAQDKTFHLKPNQWKKIDKKLKFKVNKVIEDSRCPKDVQCVWAGRVSIEIEFHYEKTIHKISLFPSTRVSDHKKILSFPITKEGRDKRSYEGFYFNGKKYLLSKVLPYPGTKGKAYIVFKIKSDQKETTKKK